MKYRPEIDGLRALAVMPVLLYHAGFSWISGGYLGVDVFFVISGYLITSILIGEISTGNFSIARFYERRARRILPALLVVILATLAFAPQVMWKWQLEELAMSALATLGFIANHFFLGVVDYFRTDSETYPLLHMWSLAVEEQYYVVMPLLLLGLWRWRPSLTLCCWIVGGLTLASLAAAAYQADRAVESAFYLLPYRAYELGFGSLAALFVARHGRLAEERSARLGPACLLIILLTYVSVPADVVLPWAKIPLLAATAVLMMSTMPAGITMRVLSSRPLRWIGLISFSLYLWHQPVFAFARLHFGHIDTNQAVALIAGSMLLAALTYRLVEQPARRCKVTQPKALMLSVLSIAATGATCMVMLSVTPAADVRSPQDASLARSVKDHTESIWTQYREIEGRAFTTDKEHVLLVGDSYSQDFWLMAKAIGAFQDAELSAHFIHYRCQPYIGTRDVSRHLSQADRQFCADRASLAPPSDILRDADTIILAAAWRPWSAGMIAEIVQDYQVHGADVIVIGRKRLRERIPLHFRAYLDVAIDERKDKIVQVEDIHFKQSEQIEAHLAGLPFVNFFKEACDVEAFTCPIFDQNGFILTFDGTHLTPEGAAYFAPKIFASPHLRRFAPTLQTSEASGL